MARAFRAAGGEIRCAAPVDEIIVRGGRTTGVRLAGGETLTARRAVLATPDPRMTPGTLLPAGTLAPNLEAEVRHIPTYANPAAHFMVHMAFSGQLRPARHQGRRRDGTDLRKAAAFFGGFDALAEAEPAAVAGRLPAELNVMCALPTAVDPTQARAGQDTAYLYAVPVPLRPEKPWSLLRDQAAKMIVTRTAEFYDGVEELEIGRWVESPEDLERRLRVSDGCFCHVDMTPWRMGPLRPARSFAGYRTPVDGLYLGGACSHTTAGISGLPGRLAAKEVLRTIRSQG